MLLHTGVGPGDHQGGHPLTRQLPTHQGRPAVIDPDELAAIAAARDLWTTRQEPAVSGPSRCSTARELDTMSNSRAAGNPPRLTSH